MAHDPNKETPPQRWHTPSHLWDKLKPVGREMRVEPTMEEDLLWQRLRNRRVAGLKFRRQHAIERFIADFYCAEARLVVEVDGEIHDATRERDEERTRILRSLGFRVLRVTNSDVRGCIDAVLQRIVAAASLPLSANGEGAGG